MGDNVWQYHPAVEELAREVIGAAIEVHRTLGPGFLENVYENAMAVELELRKIPFQRQVALGIVYKGADVGEGRVDLLVDKQLVVELKAVDALLPIHTAQALAYLHAFDLLLINFKVQLVRDGIKRITKFC